MIVTPNVIVLLCVIFLVALALGGYGYRRDPSWGYVGFSPAVLIVILLVIALLIGPR